MVFKSSTDLNISTMNEGSSSEKLEAFEKFGKVSESYDGKIIANENQEVIKVTWREYLRLMSYHGGFKVYAVL